jgi:hypothetical protein
VNRVQVAVLFTEHLPFDFIAVVEHDAVRRIQARYRASVEASLLGCEFLGCGRIEADRNGTHKRAFDPSAIDVLVIYCPSPKMFVYHWGTS